MNPEASISQAVRDARLALGLSQEDLARALNVSLPVVIRWESGEMEPNREDLDALVVLLRKQELSELANRVSRNGRSEEGPTKMMDQESGRHSTPL